MQDIAVAFFADKQFWESASPPAALLVHGGCDCPETVVKACLSSSTFKSIMKQRGGRLLVCRVSTYGANKVLAEYDSTYMWTPGGDREGRLARLLHEKLSEFYR
jgi:hypothetical protein